jgi:CRISPR-associated protein (Cas_Cas02710)
MLELRRFLGQRLLEIVVLGIAVNALLTAITVRLASPLAIGGFGLVTLMLAVVAMGVRDLRARSRQPILGAGDAFTLPRRGVILTLGFTSADSSSLVHLALRTLRPSYLGLLGSPETDRAGIPDRITERLVPDLGLELQGVKCESWEPARIREGATKAGLVIEWMLEQGLAPSEIVVDVTGGNTPMSIAAFIASEQHGVDCQYVASSWDERRPGPVPGSQRPILVTRYPSG